jgi:hypothetical protein
MKIEQQNTEYFLEYVNYINNTLGEAAHVAAEINREEANMDTEIKKYENQGVCPNCGGNDISCRETYAHVVYVRLNSNGNINRDDYIMRQEKDGGILCRCSRCAKEWQPKYGK